MDQKTIELVYDLIDDIKKSERFIAYKTESENLEASTAVQALIQDFQTAKTTYDEAKQYGTYHPDLNTYKAQLSRCKRHYTRIPYIKRIKPMKKHLMRG